MTVLRHGSTETLTAKEPSSDVAPIRYGPECVHLSAQLAAHLSFSRGLRPLVRAAKHQREHRCAHVAVTPHSCGALCVWCWMCTGLKAGETFVINFLFSRTSLWTSDMSREEMLIGLRVSWRRQELRWKLLDLLLLARQMESQQGSPAPR